MPDLTCWSTHPPHEEPWHLEALGAQRKGVWDFSMNDCSLGFTLAEALDALRTYRDRFPYRAYRIRNIETGQVITL